MFVYMKEFLWRLGIEGIAGAVSGLIWSRLGMGPVKTLVPTSFLVAQELVFIDPSRIPESPLIPSYPITLNTGVVWSK